MRLSARLEALLATIPPLGGWLTRATPAYRWDWPHLQVIQRELERLTWGENDRLILQLPPRHGKSELTTIRYPVYRLAIDPRTRVILGAYNQTLAAKFGRKARRLAEAQGVPLARDRTAVDDWETIQGGGMRAVGVGGGVTGMGGDLIIVDDPVKNREEAESEVYREKVWDWYQSDLRTRAEPGAAIVLIMTRWHQDDLVGRVLASPGADRWTVVSLPALAEGQDPLGRPEGAPLCPDRFDAAALADIRTDIGEYAFTSLYQQRPRPREGGLFKPYTWPVLTAVPAEGRMVRYWDTAGTEQQGKNDPDYTAGVLMCRLPDKRFAVVDVARFRHSVGRRDAETERVARQDRATYGGRVVEWFEQEAGVAGTERTEAIIKRLAGVPAYGERPTGSKVVRAEPLAAQGEAGNVALVHGPWLEAYRAELADFPSGKHDDQVDASSGAFNKLAQGGEYRTQHLPLGV